MGTRIEVKSIALVFMVILLLSGVAITIYFAGFSSNEKEEISVLVLIDYNNGTVEYHPLILRENFTASHAIELASKNLTVTIYVGLGTYINGINGVMENKTMGWWWLYYYLDKTSAKWVEAPVGISKFELNNDDVLLFFYFKGEPPK